MTVGSRTLPMAPLGPHDLWPQFRFQIEETPIRVPANLSAEDRAGTLANAAVPRLPYLLQDNYTRQRQSRSLPTIQVENAALRATFYPSLGGRMISLYDKRGRRELLFDNPVLQFANLAIRNAWFSGGVEWNGPLYGHSLLTCSPVFAGMVATPRGPLLRLYEFDRALETTWQVDVFLPPHDDRLWIHVKAINPNAHDVRFYWWTNIAVPLAPRHARAGAGGLRARARIVRQCTSGVSGLRRLRRQLPVQLPLRQVGLLPQARQPQAVVGLPGRARPRPKPRFHADALRPQVFHVGHRPWRETLDGVPLRERQRRLPGDPGWRHADPASDLPLGSRREHRVDRVHQSAERWIPRRRTTRTTLPHARRRAKSSTSAYRTLRCGKWTRSWSGRPPRRCRRCSIVGPAGAGCTKSGPGAESTPD